jgi:hypothetical protein
MYNKNRTLSGNRFNLPSDVVARLAKFTAEGVLVVPRMRHACDLWVGAVEGAGNPWGRGAYCWIDPITRRKLKQSAAVLAYRHRRLAGAPIPPGMHVNHVCDVESCVNPDHLYLGTPKMGGSDLHRRDAAVNQGTARLAVEKHVELYIRGRRALAPWIVRACVRLGITRFEIERRVAA